MLTGAIGLGLGFGLQSIAANFVSGFVLLMDRSIKPGDVISLSGQSGTSTENFGWVQELRGRYVVVRDRDGVEMLVPNQQLISNAVINWSYTDPRIRLKLPVRIEYKDDPELALQVLLIGVRRTAGACCASPLPVSRLMHFSDSGIELELRFWISDPQEGVNNVRSEVNRAIWRLFKQHKLTIPPAQREIRMRMRRAQEPRLIRRAARHHAADRHSGRGIRVEVHPLLRPRRPERQQGVERGAAALSAARQLEPAGGRQAAAAASRGQRLIDDGSILITARSERSQEQNRREALGRLESLIRQALVEPKIRKKTRPTRASKERRIESKKRRGSTKQQRRDRWD